MQSFKPFVQTLHLRVGAFAVGFALLVCSAGARADPPSRVARLGYTAGAVSLSPATENDWVQATLNRPLTSGDRLWAGERGRAEIQIAGAMVRMNANTGLAVLKLDDQIVQLQLTQGSLNVRVRRLEPNQRVEVDTPNLAFTLRQAGEYRITVDPGGDATDVVVRKGQGEAAGEGAHYQIVARQPYRFTGTGLRDFQTFSTPRVDEFDRWASERDSRFDASPSARFVSRDVVGYQDLDANGSWRVDPAYGNVWIPSRIAANWAPYRDGHWTWIDPWGWTWMDDAPWGYAVSHYGRWANLRGAWGWVPGPTRIRAWYAPALVAFVGADRVQHPFSSGNIGAVAWFALAPRELYRPPYAASRPYFEGINRSNTFVSNAVISTTYENLQINNAVYANRKVRGAVIAVPRSAFALSQAVGKVAVRVPREAISSAPTTATAPPGQPVQRPEPRPERAALYANRPADEKKEATEPGRSEGRGRQRQ